MHPDAGFFVLILAHQTQELCKDLKCLSVICIDLQIIKMKISEVTLKEMMTLAMCALRILADKLSTCEKFILILHVHIY